MLVTNVGQGFGRAIALAYGRAGYDVVCADRDVELATKTAAELEELSGQAIPIQADMTTQMDVLAAYHKVTEIFGELGGVVHISGHASPTPFESLAEGEFSELMSEDVRSAYLILKTAARLSSVGWVVVVGPPDLGSVQMHAVQGALERMVEGFRQRYTFPRANLVLPSRQASDPRHDQALVRAVRYFGSPESAGVSGQTMRVALPAPPSATDSLLPEVRAALQIGPDLQEQPYDAWAPWPGGADSERGSGLSVHGALSATGAGGRTANDGGLGHPLEGRGDDFSHGGLAEPDDLEPEFLDARLLDPEFEDDRDDDADRYEAGAGSDEDDDAEGYDEGQEDDYYDHWGREFGLPPGAPALRHLIGDEPAAFASGTDYVAGIESALDLYGDLSRLEGSDIGELTGLDDGSEFEEEPGARRVRSRQRP